MRTTIDKAGRVVIPAGVRDRAGLTPGTTLEVSVDETGIRLERVAPGRARDESRASPRRATNGDAEERPKIDVATRVEEERNRWP